MTSTREEGDEKERNAKPPLPVDFFDLGTFTTNWKYPHPTRGRRD